MLTAAGQLQSASGRACLGDVTAWIDTWAVPVGLEDVRPVEAVGRVLAGDVAAPIDLPPFDRAAADGFALVADETVGAGAYNPLPFRLVPAPAGVQAGHAVAVECGDPLPAGADAVVRLEHATPDAPGTIAIIAPVAAENEVERAGSHAGRGGLLVGAGRRLGPSEIGLLAAAGVQRVSVVGRPRVRCLLAADRATDGGHGLASGAVFDANGPMLAALIERDGGLEVERRRVERGRAALRDALGLRGADVVLVVGGTGPGAGDESAGALAEAGELAVHGVALRPGETAGAGRASGAPVFLLPGTPAGCLWAYELIAGAAIRRLAGRSAELPFSTREMRLGRKIVSEIGMSDVCPVRCTKDGEVEPLAPFAAAGLVAAAQGDGFVIVPETSEGYPQGASVTVRLYAGRSQPSRGTSVVQQQAGKRGSGPLRA
jgi:molybdopterin molybdotransferase